MGDYIAMVLLFNFCVLATGYAVYSLFLLTMCHTLKLIRPEHRRMSPGLVWLCLIPCAGIIPAIWMVYAVASSLRKQFNALGEHDPTETYGLVSGQIWTYAFVLAWPTPMVGALLSIGPETPGFCFAVLMMGSFGSWIAYWVRITEFKHLLQQRFPSDPTPEELDYGEDL